MDEVAKCTLHMYIGYLFTPNYDLWTESTCGKKKRTIILYSMGLAAADSIVRNIISFNCSACGFVGRGSRLPGV